MDKWRVKPESIYDYRLKEYAPQSFVCCGAYSVLSQCKLPLARTVLQGV